jgi:hypothetical protein
MKPTDAEYKSAAGRIVLETKGAFVLESHPEIMRVGDGAFVQCLVYIKAEVAAPPVAQADGDVQ